MTDWLRQNVPAWWVLLALGLGGGASLTGAGNWTWLQNNEGRLAGMSGRIDAVDRRLAGIDDAIRRLQETKVDTATRIEMLRQIEADIQQLREQYREEHAEIREQLRRQQDRIDRGSEQRRALEPPP